MLTELNSFDGTHSVRSELVRPDEHRHLLSALSSGRPSIPRGAGLSYCGAAAGQNVCSVSALLFNRVVDFDSQGGRVVVEPGLTIGDLFDFSVARGWYPPVIPGHPMITIGGCIGFNVHGKSQYHSGNFRDCVERIVLYHPDHGEIVCSPEGEPELFELTLGGFGLTGFVTSVQLRLSRLMGNSVLRSRIPVHDLIEAVDVMERECDDADALYSWNNLNQRGDAFGSGVVSVERFCPDSVPGRARSQPFSPDLRTRFPIRFFNQATTRVFCRTYGWLESLRPSRSLLRLKTAAFPINGKEIYYSLFGRTGFREYQMLVPRPAWECTVKEVEHAIADSQVPVTLGSLKLFRGRTNLLNFSGSGICLTLDVPAIRPSLALFATLDQLMLDVGGVVNLSKDSRLSGDFVGRAFPEYGRFIDQLQRYDPKRRFDSSLRRRILV